MDRILTGIDETTDYFRLSPAELINLKRDFEFPMIKKGGVFYISLDEICKWMKKWGVLDPLKISYSDIEQLYLRRSDADRPGEKISGDINKICEKLKISPATFLGLLKCEKNPVRIVPGTNQYSVDTRKDGAVFVKFTAEALLLFPRGTAGLSIPLKSGSCSSSGGRLRKVQSPAIQHFKKRKI